MRNISDTIARLQMAGGNFGGAVSTRLAPFDDFGTNPGALRARAFVPDDLPEGAPLVVVLHGCTQTADGYDLGSGWSTLADREGFAVLFPEQTRANNPNLCFNWFQPDDIRRGSGEALSIREMIGAMIARHKLDEKRVFVTGLSAGGAMTSVMLATYPEIFAGGAIIAGLPFGAARNVSEALDRMRGHGGPGAAALAAAIRAGSPDHAGAWPTVAVWHGTSDLTVVHANMNQIADQWIAVHGADPAPVALDTASGHVHRAWRDAKGRNVVETHSVRGMGHGTPIDPNGPDGLGATGPHMIDIGLSSTAMIAKSWGLIWTEADVRPKATAAKAPGKPSLARAKRPIPLPTAAPVSGVQKIIEQALRSAGLMK